MSSGSETPHFFRVSRRWIAPSVRYGFRRTRVRRNSIGRLARTSLVSAARPARGFMCCRTLGLPHSFLLMGKPPPVFTTTQGCCFPPAAQPALDRKPPPGSPHTNSCEADLCGFFLSKSWSLPRNRLVRGGLGQLSGRVQKEGWGYRLGIFFSEKPKGPPSLGFIGVVLLLSFPQKGWFGKPNRCFGYGLVSDFQSRIRGATDNSQAIREEPERKSETTDPPVLLWFQRGTKRTPTHFPKKTRPPRCFAQTLVAAIFGELDFSHQFLALVKVKSG